MMEVITVKEHEEFECTESQIDLNKVKHLNITKCGESKYRAGYYIGIDWLIEGELPIFIKPKIENLDFLKIFIDCFKQRDIREQLNEERGKKGNEKKIYELFTDKKPVALKGYPFEITPLIIIHYLCVLEGLLKRGLKRDYIRTQENLNAKIKGKIVFSQHLKKNAALGRKDRVYCNYQDYSVDCLENRLLKKAFLFAKRYFAQNKVKSNESSFVDRVMGLANVGFEGVRDIRDTRILRQFKVNKLYRDYGEALRLARLILQRFAYNIKETDKRGGDEVQPFYIDMPLIFEVYVLSKLRAKYVKEIDYQVKGMYGEVDYIKKGYEKLIIDSKYKNAYIDGSYDIEDIRQISGYARDKHILGELGVDESTVVPCLIIYPKKGGVEEFTEEKMLDETEEIKGYIKFHKIGVKLPLSPP